jgi:hypothetical protein
MPAGSRVFRQASRVGRGAGIVKVLKLAPLSTVRRTASTNPFVDDLAVPANE